LRWSGSLAETADDLTTHIDDVLGLRGDLLLVRWMTRGTLRAGGGTFELQLLSLFAVGEDGLATRIEWFAPDQVDDALARFDELASEPAATARVENAAARSMEQVVEAWNARDWRRIADLHPTSAWFFDRRKRTPLELDRDRYLESLRMMFDMEGSRSEVELLATRGDRLALGRNHFVVSDRDVGASEIESLTVVEVGDRGERVASIRFDPDDLDAAYAELDERYAAGEAAPHARVSATMRAFRTAFADRDWDALEALLAPDLVVDDHRRLGWETLHGPAAYVRALRTLVDLAPDVRLRLDHVRTSERGLLWVAAWQGAREGGPFEAPWITASEHDVLGRVCRIDQYDLDQLGVVRERFEEPRSPTPAASPPASSSRTP
jgi:hypothetical protein